MSVRLTTGAAYAEYASSILQQVQGFDFNANFQSLETHQRTHIGVEPMLLAFSMELALKAWYVFDYDTKKVIHSHNLLKLFEKLKIESQKKLDEEFKRSVAPFHPSGLHIDYSIKDLLYQNKDAFVEWRYLNENPHGIRFESYSFIATLEMVLREFKKLYREEKAPSWNWSTK